MTISDLLQTDIQLAALLGERDEREDYFVVRTPENPGFFYGNLLVLKRQPQALGLWLEAFEAAFGTETAHRCIAWSGSPLPPALSTEAQRLGLESDGGVSMSMETLPDSHEEWLVRPLDLERDWEASVALSIASDVTEQVGQQSYVAFKRGLRRTRRLWLERGLATWWGAFDGEELIGQCGLVECGQLGRFQAVETHPDWRRRGVCSSLISTVARHAFDRLGKRRLLLSAEPDGPALQLYRRLGFCETGRTHSVLRHPTPLRVREARHGDHAGVRSLVLGAFGGLEEVQLVEALRDSKGSLSLVAEQTNALSGHILFSEVRLEGPGSDLSVVVLSPLAVASTAQGKGVGKQLVQTGLDECKRAGHDLCLVSGNPDYFARFGFVAAQHYGLSNPFESDGRALMVCELKEGALSNCAGRPIYHRAFQRS